MSSRAPRSNEFEDQDYYPPPPRRGDQDFRRPRSPPPGARSPPRSRGPPPAREYERPEVRLRERSVERAPPAFLREDVRRPEHGPMVLRKREVETIDRHDARPRGSPSPPPRVLRRASMSSPSRFARRDSPSPPPRMMRRGRSPSPRAGPPPEVERSRSRFVEVERVRSPSEVRRSPSLRPIRPPDRRPRSFSPHEHEHIRTRIVERERERYSSPSPSPPPPPQVVRGPIVEREVITHYTDVDHGVIKAHNPQPVPPPEPRRVSRREGRESETDIDITLGRNRTEVEVDVHRTARSGSRRRHTHYHDDDLGRDGWSGRPRARSDERGYVYDEEAREITGRIDSRGRMGEAWGGATKDWTIVDVPPGTERVRMDGKGGGSTDTKWTNYSGVRRTQFIPERDGALVPVKAPAPVPAPLPLPAPTGGRDKVSVSYHDRNTDIDIEKTTDRRVVRAAPPPEPLPPPVTTTTQEVWTEITKDLVTRQAIEQLGYSYEESKWHFYIMSYLKSHEVRRLTDLTAQIRQARGAGPVRMERGYRDDLDVSYHRHRHHHHHQAPPRRQHHHHHHHGGGEWDWETETLREYNHYYDREGARGPVRGWYR